MFESNKLSHGNVYFLQQLLFLMAIYRVSRKDLAKGTKIESKEHPGFSDRAHRKIARQHIQRYGPGYYAAEPVTEKIVESKTKQMGAKPMKRKPRQRPYNPLGGGVPPGVW